MHPSTSPTISRLLALLAALAFTPLQAAFYKWVGEDGVVTYSSSPAGPGAELVDPVGLSHYSPPPSGPAPSARAMVPSPRIGEGYPSFVITHPAPGQSVRNATAELEVSVTVQPDLQAGHRVQLVLDGVVSPEAVVDGRALLPGVTRGAHQLAAQVLDGRGSTIAQTESVPFFFFLETVEDPQIGRTPENNRRAYRPDYPPITSAPAPEPEADEPTAPEATPGYTSTPRGGSPAYAPDYDGISAGGGRAFSPSRAYTPGYRQSN